MFLTAMRARCLIVAGPSFKIRFRFEFGFGFGFGYRFRFGFGLSLGLDRVHGAQRLVKREIGIILFGQLTEYV